jgi:c(7)-type cytochrome triheme protein
MKKLLVFGLAMLLAAGLALAQGGVKKKRPPPQDFGKVVISNHSAKANLAPVAFNHWQHRAKYTCRLCHVDIGFGMKANDTGITAADNANGNYCGTCHNGKMTFGGERIFAACPANASPQAAKDPAQAQRCSRCHAVGQDAKAKIEFADFTGKFPKQRFGNGIDWIAAEAAGQLKLIDRLDGISSKGKPFVSPADATISARAYGMPDIIFSHDKHGVWNGCALCHPDLFPSVKKEAKQAYSMNENFDGKYCGACHGKVAFPMIDCEHCHSKPVM